MKQKIKKWDFIIIGMLMIFSFIPYGLVKLQETYNTDCVYAVIAIDGKEYKKIPLTGQMNYKEYKIKTPYGDNVIAIQNESIAVIEAQCKDHICERFGYKKMPGDTIVCLPHRLYIEVKGKAADNSGIDAKGY